MKLISRRLLAAAHVFVVAAVVAVVTLGAVASPAAEAPTAPSTHNGKKWRIAYYEGGEYIDYQKNFVAMLHGLRDLGWLAFDEVPPQQGEGVKDLWKWLGTLDSPYLEFVPDACYSANWDDAAREATRAALLGRLATGKDIDLVFALGTWAGQDLAVDGNTVPCVVMATANPQKAGIIKSAEDSGRDNIHARIAPERFLQQIRVFHDVVGFKKLGVAYEDTPAGRTYAAMDALEALAPELGYEIIGCHTKSDIADKAQAEASAIACFRELSTRADAIYVTVQGGVSERSLPEVVKIALDARIPTFSQNGSDEVRQGLLMSISLAGYKYVGQFYARTMAQILNGAKPRALPQIFEDPPKIAINLKTAEIIQFDPPVDMLLAADEVFEQIEPAR
jgi:ABC-type uncharacterized transport system substrate-binding protein